MLTHRTQILLDEETIKTLKHLAKQQKTTVGKLVRKAIKNNYFIQDPYSHRKQVLKNILKTRPQISNKAIDYKELINYGRK